MTAKPLLAAPLAGRRASLSLGSNVSHARLGMISGRAVGKRQKPWAGLLLASLGHSVAHLLLFMPCTARSAPRVLRWQRPALLLQIRWSGGPTSYWVAFSDCRTLQIHIVCSFACFGQPRAHAGPRPEALAHPPQRFRRGKARVHRAVPSGDGDISNHPSVKRCACCWSHHWWPTRALRHHHPVYTLWADGQCGTDL